GGLGGIEAGHELVEQEQPGTGGQGSGQLPSLAVDERPLRRWHALAGAHGDHRDETVHLGRRGTCGVTVATVEPADEDVLAGGQAGEGTDELEGAGDAPTAR